VTLINVKFSEKYCALYFDKMQIKRKGKFKYIWVFTVLCYSQDHIVPLAAFQWKFCTLNSILFAVLPSETVQPMSFGTTWNQYLSTVWDSGLP